MFKSLSDQFIDKEASVVFVRGVCAFSSCQPLDVARFLLNKHVLANILTYAELV